MSDSFVLLRHVANGILSILKINK